MFALKISGQVLVEVMLFNAAQPGVGRVQVLGIKKMEEEELLEKYLEVGLEIPWIQYWPIEGSC